MDHHSSCRSAEIAPNQSELRWAIAELVAMHECGGDEDYEDDGGDDNQVGDEDQVDDDADNNLDVFGRWVRAEVRK